MDINDTLRSVNNTANVFSNDHRQLLSTDGKNIFILINHVILSTLFSLFGIIANTVNILVFHKQGLRMSMNLSFFILAITDLMGLLTQLWHNFCLNPYIDQMNAPLEFMEIQFLTAGNPNACLVRITGWITVYITAERCLSIAIPLKIKQVVTFERTAIILLIIYIINVASLVPLYFSAYFSWNFYPQHNRTMLGVSYKSNKLIIQDLLYIFQASLALVAFACAIIFTSILIITLKEKSKWRQKSTFDKDQNKPMSNREKKTVRMVIVVASVLIVCYTPACTNSIVSAIIQDYTITGRQSNIFQAVWSFGFLFHSVNSSITILLYHRMSSKYKITFQQMFSGCWKQNDVTSQCEE
ncbi:growth hormone secretagogue receptor type 1 [Biomphalaria glabrata]|nr:growth hormone secretagogue receptor type 1 [Biomphalaria glabrata]